MPLIEWANDNDGYVDFVGHISAVRQRSQLIADHAVQNRLLAEQIEIHREALAIQKQAQLEHQTMAAWQDILFEVGEALKLIEAHFQVAPQQAYAEWREFNQAVACLDLHHRLFRDLHWKSLCNATLGRVHYIRDNLDSFISPSQRRTFEQNLQKRQKALAAEEERIRAEAEREAAERQSALAAHRAKRNRVLVSCLAVFAIAYGLWVVREWLPLLLIITGAVLAAIFGARRLASHISRREVAPIPNHPNTPLLTGSPRTKARNNRTRKRPSRFSWETKRRLPFLTEESHTLIISEEGIRFDSNLFSWDTFFGFHGSMIHYDNAIVLKLKNVDHKHKVVGMSQTVFIEIPATQNIKEITDAIMDASDRYCRNRDLTGYRFKK